MVGRPTQRPKRDNGSDRLSFDEGSDLRQKLRFLRLIRLGIQIGYGALSLDVPAMNLGRSRHVADTIPPNFECDFGDRFVSEVE